MNNNQGAGKAPDKGAQHAGSGATEHGRKGAAEGRHEVGDAQSSRQHPPHITPNDRNAPLQGGHESPDTVSVLPANAAGKDQQSGDGAGYGIDEESMYDGRRSGDKDQPPTESGGA